MLRKLTLMAAAITAIAFTAPAHATVINTATVGTTTITAVDSDATEAAVNSVLANQATSLVELSRVTFDPVSGAGTFTGPGFFVSLGQGDQLSGNFTITSGFAEGFIGLGVLAVAAVFEGQFVLFDYTLDQNPIINSDWCVDGRCAVFDENGNGVLVRNTGVFLTDFAASNPRRIESVILFGNTLDAINGVPEPATWLLMLMGFGGVAVALRRRRNSALAF